MALRTETPPSMHAQTYLGLVDSDGARLWVGLLGEDGGVDLGRRLIVVNPTLRELFLLLRSREICQRTMSMGA